MVFKNGGYYNENGIRGTVTGIQAIITQPDGQPQRIYTLDGRYAGTDYTTLPRGLYIVNGRKVIP